MAFNRNHPYAVPQDSYQTPLAGSDEAKFRDWVAQTKAPFDPDDPASDYDMRGYWSEVARGGGDQTQTNPNDQQPHYPDTYKTPFHESFSNESRYALPNAPRWNDRDQLIDETGQVVFDEPRTVRQRAARRMAETGDAR